MRKLLLSTLATFFVGYSLVIPTFLFAQVNPPSPYLNPDCKYRTHIYIGSGKNTFIYNFRDEAINFFDLFKLHGVEAKALNGVNDIGTFKDSLESFEWQHCDTLGHEFQDRIVIVMLGHGAKRAEGGHEMLIFDAINGRDNFINVRDMVEAIRHAIRPADRVPITIMVSSCYSGRWIEVFNQSLKRYGYSVNVFTASGPEEPQWSMLYPQGFRAGISGFLARESAFQQKVVDINSVADLNAMFSAGALIGTRSREQSGYRFAFPGLPPGLKSAFGRIVGGVRQIYVETAQELRSPLPQGYPMLK